MDRASKILCQSRTMQRDSRQRMIKCAMPQPTSRRASANALQHPSTTKRPNDGPSSSESIGSSVPVVPEAEGSSSCLPWSRLLDFCIVFAEATHNAVVNA